MYDSTVRKLETSGADHVFPWRIAPKLVPHRQYVRRAAYRAGGTIEYTAFRSARSRGSPVTDVPIRLVT
jgi:hypothetical protein